MELEIILKTMIGLSFVFIPNIIATINPMSIIKYRVILTSICTLGKYRKTENTINAKTSKITVSAIGLKPFLIS